MRLLWEDEVWADYDFFIIPFIVGRLSALIQLLTSLKSNVVNQNLSIRFQR